MNTMQEIQIRNLSFFDGKTTSSWRESSVNFDININPNS